MRAVVETAPNNRRVVDVVAGIVAGIVAVVVGFD